MELNLVCVAISRHERATDEEPVKENQNHNIVPVFLAYLVALLKMLFKEQHFVYYSK